MSRLSDSFLNELRSVLGETGLRCDGVAVTLDPGMDAGNLGAGVVALPASRDHMQAVVRLCAEHAVAMVPQGGRTGLAGGAVSQTGQLIVATARLNQPLEIDAAGGTALVGAGVPLSALQEAAAEHGLSPGIDLAARDSATIGGLIATNAGGIEAFRFGTMRHRVLGLEAVMADGGVVDDLKRVVKANEGYGISQLLCGAEGTLGIITRAALKLVPKDPDPATALVACSTAGDALALFHRLHQAPGSTLLAAEIMWPDFARGVARNLKLDAVVDFAPDHHVYLLVDLAAADNAQERLEEALADALEAGEAADAVFAKSGEDRRRMWLVREESFEADKTMPHGFWYDISVPHACLQDYTDALFQRMAAIDPALVLFMFGHLGDGNLHLTVTKGEPMEELHDRVNAALFDGLVEAGGSFSAEHGIGLEKRSYLRHYGSGGKLSAMDSVKSALDPQGLMNPGKVL
tara:strand:- start:2959 stop:4344 length:1386 start_codon:yes stop_codon:yes gene_type:complete